MLMLKVSPRLPCIVHLLAILCLLSFNAKYIIMYKKLYIVIAINFIRTAAVSDEGRRGIRVDYFHIFNSYLFLVSINNIIKILT